jgi:hypothetical protein
MLSTMPHQWELDLLTVIPSNMVCSFRKTFDFDPTHIVPIMEHSSVTSAYLIPSYIVEGAVFQMDIVRVCERSRWGILEGVRQCLDRLSTLPVKTKGRRVREFSTSTLIT